MDARIGSRRATLGGTALLVALCAFICQSRLIGWSSVIPSSRGLRVTAFATHEVFNEIAYKALAKHPAVTRGVVRLPAIGDIQDNSWINLDQSGNGPDNPKLSDYSWHWFNPEPGIGESKTPLVVARYFGALRNVFLTQHLAATDASPRGDGAHQAAWAAHFIQDMTCPFHVVGVSIPPAPALDQFVATMNGFAANDAMKEKIGGPYGHYTPAEWRAIVKVAVDAFVADPKKDWFDPNYNDGHLGATTLKSGHFEYEENVALAYRRRPQACDPVIWLAGQKGYISPLWHNDVPVEEFTRAVARETRQRMTPGSPLVFDSRDERARLDVPLPCDDFVRAIDATYSIWRASFSALWIAREDVKLVKLPDQADLYEVFVSAQNLEPAEPATQVSVVAEIPLKGFRGRVTVTDPIGDRLSAWYSAGKLRLNGHDDRPGTIRLTVSGVYRNTPDAQQAIYEYPLDRIESEGEITLEDMAGWPVERAKNYLDRLGLVMVDQAAGNPKTDLAQFTVQSHKPAGGATVARGERVTVWVFGQYRVAVPNLLAPPLQRASAENAVTKARLEPVVSERETDRSIPEGQVVAQDPAPGTMVPLRSLVDVYVARHAPQALPPPTTAVVVKNVAITPSRATIRLDQTATFTATVIGANDAPVDQATLGQIRFGWDVTPQSAATISGDAGSAVLTPREPGPAWVTCVVSLLAPGRSQPYQTLRFPRAAEVIILPPETPPKQEPPPIRQPAQDDPCARLERVFRAALNNGDLKTATSILAEARECPFAKEGLRALDQTRDQQCRDLYGEIQSALRGGNQALAASLLEKGRAMGCQFPAITAQPETPPAADSNDPHELEGAWKSRNTGWVIRFRKVSPDSYVGIFEANPDNKPYWVKVGEQIARATRTGIDTYKLEMVEYRMKNVGPGNWVRDDATLRWLYGDLVWRVHGETAGYDTNPDSFTRLRTPGGK
jgi:hypothetical protein